MKAAHGNEKGMALVMTLMFILLGFAMVLTLIAMATEGIRLGGVDQKYRTALDGAKSGSEFLINMIRMEITVPPNFLAAVGSSTPACLNQKLTSVTSSTNWSSCSSFSQSSNVDPTIAPDIVFVVSGYNVSVKIVDTKETPSAYCYTIITRAQAPQNPAERAEILILYESDK